MTPGGLNVFAGLSYRACAPAHLVHDLKIDGFAGLNADDQLVAGVLTICPQLCLVNVPRDVPATKRQKGAPRRLSV